MHNDNSTQNRTTLVLGGTGKTGRRVVERLEARGLPVRVGSRSGEPPFDWEIPADLGAGARGGRLPSTSPTTRTSRARAPSRPPVRSPSWRSRAAPRRLVLLSGRGEPIAERAEQAVRDTGAELTILRSTWFMQNFSEDYMREHVLSGEIRLPAGDVPDAVRSTPTTSPTSPSRR